MYRAVAAARQAFDQGPWPRLAPPERAGYLRAIADGLRARAEDLSYIWASEMGILHVDAVTRGARIPGIYEFYAGLADSFEFVERHEPAGGGYGWLVREPVGVVGAIIPWNAAIVAMSWKIAPALLAGCTVVLKSAPEAPVAAYLLAEVAEQAGLPPGVLNIITADREVSEELVRDPGIDKISFTGSTAAGRRIAANLRRAGGPGQSRARRQVRRARYSTTTTSAPPPRPSPSRRPSSPARCARRSPGSS